MKTLLILILTLSLNCEASEPKSTRLKASFIAAGAFTITGATINYLAAQKVKPENANPTQERLYLSKQNSMHRVANIFFVGAGVSLISISFNF